MLKDTFFRQVFADSEKSQKNTILTTLISMHIDLPLIKNFIMTNTASTLFLDAQLYQTDYTQSILGFGTTFEILCSKMYDIYGFNDYAQEILEILIEKYTAQELLLDYRDKFGNTALQRVCYYLDSFRCEKKTLFNFLIEKYTA